MIGFYLLEGFTLFAGVTLWFLITQKGSAVVTTNFANVFKTLIQDTPPMPNIDIIMWSRLGLLMFVAWALHEDFELTVNIMQELWNDIVVYIWGILADFGQLLVFFVDLAIPLYNWYVTLFSQLTTGSYTILAKCQQNHHRVSRPRRRSHGVPSGQLQKLRTRPQGTLRHI